MTQPQKQFNLARLIFGVLFIVILIVASFWVIRPFILGFIMGRHGGDRPYGLCSCACRKSLAVAVFPQSSL